MRFHYQLHAGGTQGQLRLIEAELCEYEGVLPRYVQMHKPLLLISVVEARKEKESFSFSLL